MLQLSRKGLLDPVGWQAADIELPTFDLELVAHNTGSSRNGCISVQVIFFGDWSQMHSNSC